LRAFADDAVLREVSMALEANGYRTHEFGDSVLIEKKDDAALAGGLPRGKGVLSLGKRKACSEPPRAFEVQESFLSPQQPTVAAQLSALVDHPMTRNEYRDSIQAVGASNGSLPAGQTDSAREVFV
jgi:hypothetical protein